MCSGTGGASGNCAPNCAPSCAEVPRRTLRFSAISTHLYCSRSSAHTTESFVAFTVAPRFDPYSSAGSPNHEAGPKWATRRAGSDAAFWTRTSNPPKWTT